MGWYGLNLSGLGYGSGESSCEHGNEPSGSIKRWEILKKLAVSHGLSFMQLVS
jgi:hypothetical protein